MKKPEEMGLLELLDHEKEVIKEAEQAKADRLRKKEEDKWRREERAKREREEEEQRLWRAKREREEEEQRRRRREEEERRSRVKADWLRAEAAAKAAREAKEARRRRKASVVNAFIALAVLVTLVYKFPDLEQMYFEYQERERAEAAEKVRNEELAAEARKMAAEEKARTVKVQQEILRAEEIRKLEAARSPLTAEIDEKEREVSVISSKILDAKSNQDQLERDSARVVKEIAELQGVVLAKTRLADLHRTKLADLQEKQRQVSEQLRPTREAVFSKDNQISQIDLELGERKLLGGLSDKELMARRTDSPQSRRKRCEEKYDSDTRNILVRILGAIVKLTKEEYVVSCMNHVGFNEFREKNKARISELESTRNSLQKERLALANSINVDLEIQERDFGESQTRLQRQIVALDASAEDAGTKLESLRKELRINEEEKNKIRIDIDGLKQSQEFLDKEIGELKVKLANIR